MNKIKNQKNVSSLFSKNIFSDTIFILIFCCLFVLLIHVPTSVAYYVDAPVIELDVYNYDPNPIYAGDVVDMRFRVMNKGTEATEDIIIQFENRYPFSVPLGDSLIRNVSALNGYASYRYENSKIIEYQVLVDKTVPAGIYDLYISYTEKGSLGVITKMIPLEIKTRQSAEIIHIDKSVIIPGQEDSLEFTITNTGKSPLRDLTFSWENSDDIILPVESDNTRYIDSIPVGGSVPISYKVIADTNAQAGLYKLDLDLTYFNTINNSPARISTIAGIYIGGATDFDVAFSESSNGQMSFTVANIGSNPANSVSVVIPEQRMWKVGGSNTVIIGNLDKGDYTVASFKLTQVAINDSSVSSRMMRNQTRQASSEVAPMPSSMPSSDSTIASSSGIPFRLSNDLGLQIVYTDTMGKRMIVSKNISMNSVASSGNFSSFGIGRRNISQNNNNTYIYVIVVFVILVASWVLYVYKHAKTRGEDFHLSMILPFFKNTTLKNKVLLKK